MTEPRDPSIEAALAVLNSIGVAATSYGRVDLARRLERKAESLRDPAFHVLVVGEFKQGKSSLLNALLSRDVCPVDDDIATAVPTIIRWSDEPGADVLFEPTSSGRDPVAPAERLSIGVDDVGPYAVEGIDTDRRVQSVEIRVPSRLLSGGLVLVDTPGVGGLGSTHGAVTAAAVPMAEAVIFVTDASQEFTAPELEFMQATRKLCPNMVVLVTKIDFYPAWRRIRDLNREHLDRLDIDAPILAASATLHHQAVASGDANLLGESGYPELSSFIRTTILGSAVQLSVAAAASDVRDVLDQLSAHFATRKHVLEDPDIAEAKTRELEQARARAEELKGRAARWQVTLGDAVQDLNTDVDHDLRERFRLITQEGDEALGNADPAAIWPEFEPWLYHRTAVEVLGNYELLQQRAREVVERVGDHFEADAGSIEIAISDPTAALAQVGSRAELETEGRNLAGAALLGLRGGMGGMMMFGMLSSLVGVALGPVGIGLGVVMGRKQLRDEKMRNVAQRQMQARAAQRKYLDEATFRTGKESRDALKSIQRQIRDHFTTRAEEQATSVQEMLIAVQSAAKVHEQERSSQLAEVNAELDRLARLRIELDALGPTVSAPASIAASR